jgi:hypothetical protein
MQNACVKCHKRVHSPGNKFSAFSKQDKHQLAWKTKLIKVGQEQKLFLSIPAQKTRSKVCDIDCFLFKDKNNETIFYSEHIAWFNFGCY